MGAKPAARGTVARRSTAGSGRAAGGGPGGAGVLRFYTEESPGFAMYVGLPLCSTHAPLWPRMPLRSANALFKAAVAASGRSFGCTPVG